MTITIKTIGPPGCGKGQAITIMLDALARAGFKGVYEGTRNEASHTESVTIEVEKPT